MGTMVIGSAMMVNLRRIQRFQTEQRRKTRKNAKECATNIPLFLFFSHALVDKIVLPCDHVVAPEFMSDDAQVTCCVGVPEGMMGLDIGPKSIEEFTAIIAQAGTVVWNGPMGVFEREPYAGGTKAVMNAIAEATENNGCISVIGGGDSAAAVKQFGLADKMTHVSTGGGASLTYLEGKPMPPIDILD